MILNIKFYEREKRCTNSFTPLLLRNSTARPLNSLPKREVKTDLISSSSGKSLHLEAAYTTPDAASFSSSGHSLHSKRKILELSFRLLYVELEY